jgi:hypothetical protein
VARSLISIAAAWRAAVEVTARAYGLNPKVLAATRNGAGRPTADPSYWEPRKLALYVAVLTVDCTYAALAQAIGMHRDTVTSQCEEIRKNAASSPLLERRTEVLERRARQRMSIELVGIVEDAGRALVRAYELTGITETAEQAAWRESIVAGIGRIATLGPDNPTKNCGEADAQVITFPRSAEAAE